jgi:hypothetical protein
LLQAGHSPAKVALAVKARYVSGSLLAEGIEGDAGQAMTASFEAFDRRTMDARAAQLDESI